MAKRKPKPDTKTASDKQTAASSKAKNKATPVLTNAAAHRLVANLGALLHTIEKSDVTEAKKSKARKKLVPLMAKLHADILAGSSIPDDWAATIKAELKIPLECSEKGHDKGHETHSFGTNPVSVIGACTYVQSDGKTACIDTTAELCAGVGVFNASALCPVELD